MAENSAAASLGKLGLGLGVGFALYFFITGLGFGGEGRGRGEGRGEGLAVPESPVPPVPPRPKDEKRLNVLMSSRGFELRDENWKPPPSAKIYALEEMIARVKEGGRNDLALKVSGDVIQGDYDKALKQLKQVGIVVWKAETSVPAPVRTSGNARGQYGAHGGSR